MRPRALVIDDSPHNIEVIAERLSDAYDIQYALSGPEGLALVAEKLPDLILLDAMMPGMDGYAVCDALQRDPRTREVPVIFVTAKSDAESESRALAAGAVDFIHKPINFDVLRARVRLHIAFKASELERRQFNAELERRVEDRTSALREALIQAEAAYRAKSLFLANVNQELRTLMNALLELPDLLSRQANDLDKARERIDRISNACQALSGFVVDDVSDVADPQAGKACIDPADFPLPQ